MKEGRERGRHEARSVFEQGDLMQRLCDGNVSRTQWSPGALEETSRMEGLGDDVRVTEGLWPQKGPWLLL